MRRSMFSRGGARAVSALLKADVAATRNGEPWKGIAKKRQTTFGHADFEKGKDTMRTTIVLAALLIAAPVMLRAQTIADGATNILSNVTNTITGNVTIGTNGSFTLLVLSDNTLLTNSDSGIIGANTTAMSNEVRLLSPTARWLPGGNLFVGSNGAFNRLVVSNGATVRDGASFVGFIGSGSNNLALVTGSGSVWDAGGLYLGF